MRKCEVGLDETLREYALQLYCIPSAMESAEAPASAPWTLF